MAKKLPHALYVVATPIGNPRDISLRAVETLESADAVICEELRQGSTLLKKLGIEPRELLVLNEHNEGEVAPDLAHRLALGETFALISDGGTPVFADPGSRLVALAAELGVRVTPVPGASSLMAALSLLDNKMDTFFFAGFLPPKNEIRQRLLEKYRSYRHAVILMDTPYRLLRTLEEVEKVFGKGQRVTLACDLTQRTEALYRGSVSEVRQALRKQKAEFILVLHAPGDSRRYSE